MSNVRARDSGVTYCRLESLIGRWGRSGTDIYRVNGMSAPTSALIPLSFLRSVVGASSTLCRYQTKLIILVATV